MKELAAGRQHCHQIADDVRWPCDKWSRCVSRYQLDEDRNASTSQSPRQVAVRRGPRMQRVDGVSLESRRSRCQARTPRHYASAVIWFQQVQMMCRAYHVTNSTRAHWSKSQCRRNPADRPWHNPLGSAFDGGLCHHPETVRVSMSAHHPHIDVLERFLELALQIFCRGGAFGLCCHLCKITPKAHGDDAIASASAYS
jgi:hypothetical protein